MVDGNRQKAGGKKLASTIRAVASVTKTSNMLQPLANSTRQIIFLDGIWNFALAKSHALRHGAAWTRCIPPRLQAPIPASYSIMLVDKSFRDHVSWFFHHWTEACRDPPGLGAYARQTRHRDRVRRRLRCDGK